MTKKFLGAIQPKGLNRIVKGPKQDSQNMDNTKVKSNDLLSSVPLFVFIGVSIRVIAKLPNSEQSYKGKVKTHNYINRQNQSTTGKL